jgi:hypothetical protein
MLIRVENLSDLAIGRHEAFGQAISALLGGFAYCHNLAATFHHKFSQRHFSPLIAFQVD